MGPAGAEPWRSRHNHTQTRPLHGERRGQVAEARVRDGAMLITMKVVALEDGALRLGALVTIATLLEHPLVRQHAPLLSEAADHFASDQIRNAATVGGNLCNASPAGDTLVPRQFLDSLGIKGQVRVEMEDGKIVLKPPIGHGGRTK